MKMPSIPKDLSRLLLNRALEIIGPTAKKEDVQGHLRIGLRYVNRQRSFKTSGQAGVMTGDQRAAARKFEIALHSLKIAFVEAEKVNLTRSIFINFPMDEKYIEIWRARAEKAAGTKPVGKSKPENLVAIRQAAKLLRRYDIKLKKSRTGKLCRMAAVFLGDPSDDGAKKLYEPVRDYLDEAAAKASSG
jgi:hypothetical protein